jgi:hypothetical protein
MKNVFILALLALSISTSAFASGENKISSVVLNSFKVDFKGAKDVSWSSRTGYSKAAFKLENRDMEVFYKPDGSIFAVSKNIELDELPVDAKRSFAKKYQGYTVKEAIAFESADENAFYISAENEKESVILKVDQHESLYLLKTSKKSK